MSGKLEGGLCDSKMGRPKQRWIPLVHVTALKCYHCGGPCVTMIHGKKTWPGAIVNKPLISASLLTSMAFKCTGLFYYTCFKCLFISALQWCLKCHFIYTGRYSYHARLSPIFLADALLNSELPWQSGTNDMNCGSSVVLTFDVV